MEEKSYFPGVFSFLSWLALVLSFYVVTAVEALNSAAEVGRGFWTWGRKI